MSYRRHGPIVEFDPDAVFETVIAMIGRCAEGAALRHLDHALIVLTGQAGSLVLVGGNGYPVAPGVSSMDLLLVAEAAEVANDSIRPKPSR